MPPLKIKDWNPNDRPREKMIAQGAAALTDAELVAILLHSGTRHETAVEVARHILALGNYNLHELGKVERTQLQKIKGVGTAKAITLMAALELGRRRASTEAGMQTVITSASDVAQLMAPVLADLPHEEMWLLLLNRANRVTERIKVSQGGVHATVIDPRMILKPAIERLSAGIILVHNHPSGNPQPSADDRKQTGRLKQAAALFDIQLLDHVIVTHSGHYSLAEEWE